MENKLKTLQEAKSIFEKLKTDPKSVLFLKEKIDKRPLKKLKISSYGKDNLLLNLINLVENDIDQINQQEQIMSKKEKLIDQPCIALMVPFSLLMLMSPT